MTEGDKVYAFHWLMTIACMTMRVVVLLGYLSFLLAVSAGNTDSKSGDKLAVPLAGATKDIEEIPSPRRKAMINGDEPVPVLYPARLPSTELNEENPSPKIKVRENADGPVIVVPGRPAPHGPRGTYYYASPPN